METSQKIALSQTILLTYDHQCLLDLGYEVKSVLVVSGSNGEPKIMVRIAPSGHSASWLTKKRLMRIRKELQKRIAIRIADISLVENSASNGKSLLRRMGERIRHFFYSK